LIIQKVDVVHQFIKHVLGDVGFFAGDGLDQSVVNENVLFFGLHQKVALRTDVAQETEHVDAFFVLDLLEHGVQDDVGARATNTGAGIEGKYLD
jgi:hypothetical protein